jgi:SAM-dependent methyltransferase
MTAMNAPDLKAVTQANRAAWDASAQVHAQGDEWAALLAGFAQAGFSTFDDCITGTLQELDLAGKTAVQIGCNNGRELLSLARFGAVLALGIDQSAGFLAQAAQLARAANSDCTFLCADIYDLPDTTPRNHDFALITIGVLNWMPDLPQFFRIVSGLLGPQGRLLIYETHPILDMYDPDAPNPQSPLRSYFQTAPQVLDDVITYDGSDAGKGARSYWFAHPLGTIVTAIATAGLRVEALTEHPHSNREVDYDQYQNQPAQLPLSYTLIAQRG